MERVKVHYEMCPKCNSNEVETEIINWIDSVETIDGFEHWVGIAEGCCLHCGNIFNLEADGLEPVQEVSE